MNFPFTRCKNVGRTFVRFVTIHACDGQTDGRTDRRTLHSMQRGKNASHSAFAQNIIYCHRRFLQAYVKQVSCVIICSSPTSPSSLHDGVFAPSVTWFLCENRRTSRLVANKTVTNENDDRKREDKETRITVVTK